MKQILPLVFCCLIGSSAFAQETLQDTVFPQHLKADCEVFQPREKLKGRRYATVNPIYLRAENTEYTYAVLHIGKRGGQLYFYLDVLTPSVCFKEGKIIDIHFTNGEILTLKNEYPINCEGIFATRMSSKMRKYLTEKNIAKIELFSYEKNYDFFVSDIQDLQIKKNIHCLKQYRYKR
ncbi:hypothetical protein EQP59_02140 [Ornithobacterium rhinotracheale]|uniref:Uncharacterized protein n=1 Tax=Ornithobacterium rhinotracheale TaxID=28251 RepID=A0A410JQ02_ORNRH|nr:hypothetical protein [Ornithobacterium rhinotracheale]QAR30240.1 hypothetical protein EQP59_02140 [Ornithobacterium rhinotracheale]